MFPQLLWLIDLFFTVRERGNYHHYGGWLTFTLSSHSQPTFFSVSMKSRCLYANVFITATVYSTLISVRHSDIPDGIPRTSG